VSTNHYTYRVTYSAEDAEFVATAAEFPSLSWLAEEPAAALQGLTEVVAGVVEDLRENGEPIPEPLVDRRYSGKFNVRVPESLHRELVVAAAEQGISLNRLASDRLAHVEQLTMRVGLTPGVSKERTAKKAVAKKGAAKKTAKRTTAANRAQP